MVGFEKGKEEGREEGRAEGREEGQREATLTLLRRFLAIRFAVELDRFDTDFEALDLQAITKLSDTAFEAQTLAEFEAVLAELKAEQQVERDSEAKE